MLTKKPITEEFVQRAIIKYLSQNEWGTNLQFGGLREQVAKKLLLYVFSVDGKGKVKKYGWQVLKKHQK